MVKLMERWCEAEDNIQAKTEIIHALQKELTLQRGAVRDPAMIKVGLSTHTSSKHSLLCIIIIRDSDLWARQ
ncbi:hypothetical protein B7P43_G17798 [Cryptotermes secundus]|uniref:Uncharacterized protein n=1 Tax=Cryptotermes secundus TaxID=105785 RepID=A0A2J7REH5_9NEOP|nr:hypothetical protein B7P43_G17798 [Cryptotermes secundus]